MTVSGILTLVALVAIGLKLKSQTDFFVGCFAFLLALSVNWITATAFMLGGQEINCDDIVLVVCVISGFLLVSRGTVFSRKIPLFSIALLIVIFVGFLTCMLFGQDVRTIGSQWDEYYYGQIRKSAVTLSMRSWLIFFRVALFCFLATVCAAVLNRDRFHRIAHIVIAFSSVHVAFAFFELVTKVFLGSDIALTISQTIFVSMGSTVDTIVVRGDMTMLQGFTREGSHFARAMFFTALICIFLYAQGDSSRRENIVGLLAALLMLASAAFTSVLCAVVLVPFLVLSVSKRPFGSSRHYGVDVRVVILLLVFVAIAALFIVSAVGGNGYYAGKLENVLAGIQSLIAGNFSASASNVDGMTRVMSWFEAVRVWISFPLFGIGLGTVSPHSGVFAILCNTGFVGLAIWLCILVGYSSDASGKGTGRYLLLLAMSSGLFTMDISIMYSPIWLLLGGLLDGLKRPKAVAQLTNRRMLA